MDILFKKINQIMGILNLDILFKKKLKKEDNLALKIQTKYNFYCKSNQLRKLFLFTLKTKYAVEY